MSPAPGVNVAPDGMLAATNDVIVSPSESAACTTKVNSEFSVTVAEAGAATTGAPSMSLTVIAVVSAPLSALLAMKRTA